MKETRRRFSAAFKAKVALEAIKERDTLASLSNEYGIHGNMIKKWKQDFLTLSIKVFEAKTSGHDFESEREKLYAKIGQLEMENDWLKKKLGRG